VLPDVAPELALSGVDAAYRLAGLRIDDGIDRHEEAVVRLVVQQRLMAVRLAVLEVRIPRPVVAAEHAAFGADDDPRHLRGRLRSLIDLLAEVLVEDRAV